MIFWASSECYQPAAHALTKTRLCVEPFLNAAFAASSLAKLDAKLRYIPIVMPKDMREKYTERSKLRKKQRIYDCAPHLDFNIFVDGSFEDQLREYVRGIALSTSHLVGLGTSEEQVADFEEIMASAAERISPEQEVIKWYLKAVENGAVIANKYILEAAENGNEYAKKVLDE